MVTTVVASGPAPAITAVSTHEALLAWWAGEISTLDMLAEGGPFRLDGHWTELVVVHGLVQLTLMAPPEATAAVDLDGMRTWAAATADAPVMMSVEEVLRRWPWPK